MAIDTLQLIKECLSNSHDLLEESITLYNRGKWARSTMLAITAYEEALKAGLVRAYRNRLLTSQEFKKIFTSHNFKLLSKYARICEFKNLESNKVYAKMYIPSKNPADQISEFLNKRQNPFQEVESVLRDRNNSLYVDFTGTTISSPKEIKSRTAHKFIKMAKQQEDWETMMEKSYSMVEDNDIELNLLNLWI